MNKGFMMLFRDYQDDPLYFSERFTRSQAFLDLCFNASYTDRTFRVRGNKVELKPGQLAISLRDLAVRWQWSVNTVKKFLLELKEDGYIDTQKTSVNQVIIIKKYVTFDTQNDTQTDTQNDTPIIKNNKDNNIKEEDTNVSKKKNPESEREKEFEAFRKRYKELGGKARGFETEFDNLKKKHRDWKDIIPLLSFALEKENKERVQSRQRGDFFPSMKNLQTYINQRSWESYSDGFEDYDPNGYNPKDMEYDQDFEAYRFYGSRPQEDVYDGYTADNRPDGARVVEQCNVWVWRSGLKDWERIW